MGKQVVVANELTSKRPSKEPVTLHCFSSLIPQTGLRIVILEVYCSFGSKKLARQTTKMKQNKLDRQGNTNSKIIITVQQFENRIKVRVNRKVNFSLSKNCSSI